jgi:hypothetical protein
MSAVENTSNRDPLTQFVGMIGGGTDAYITGMESAGQAQLVASSLLPTEAPWSDLEALGFVKGEPVSGDDLFTNVTFPAGWTRAATDHAMHSDVLDERGITRVSVFYKAAFYDRRATAHVIDVGSSLSMHEWYGEGPATLPSQWEVLTEAERLGYREALRGSIEHDEDFIKRYAQDDDERIARVARGRQLLELAVHA